MSVRDLVMILLSVLVLLFCLEGQCSADSESTPEPQSTSLATRDSREYHLDLLPSFIVIGLTILLASYALFAIAYAVCCAKSRTMNQPRDLEANWIKRRGKRMSSRVPHKSMRTRIDSEEEDADKGQSSMHSAMSTGKGKKTKPLVAQTGNATPGTSPLRHLQAVPHKLASMRKQIKERHTSKRSHAKLNMATGKARPHHDPGRAHDVHKAVHEHGHTSPHKETRRPASTGQGNTRIVTYNEGVKYYKKILKSIHSVKSVSQYFAK